MIVKNEHRVIKRCLESVKPLIDYWVIVDTGSNDGTQEIIRETMKGIPGELHERPWVDFSFNRTEALNMAKGKGHFALLIDADEQIVIEPGFTFPDPNEQVYIVDVHYDRAIFHREIFVNNNYDWYWEGVLHEQIYCRQKLEKVVIAKKVYNLSLPDGNRSLTAGKYEMDAVLLEKALQREPQNARYVFYLAQSYACSAKWPEAKRNYDKRAQMGGWNQEVYYSIYASGYMQEKMNMDPHGAIDTYAKAYQFRPTRVEPLFRIACIYFNNGHYGLAKIVTKFGIGIPLSPDSMFVEPAVYQFGMRLLYADCCRALDEREEAIREYEIVMKIQSIPPEVTADIRRNIAHMKALPPKQIIPESIPYL